jgi:tight adherence protein B
VNHSDATLLLKLAATLTLFVCVAGLTWLLSHGLSVERHGVLARYVQSLDAEQRLLFLPERGRSTALGQGLGIVLVIAAAGFLRMPSLSLLGLAIAAAPKVVLSSLRERRKLAIDAKLDGFALTLSNAMRATPSIGRALAMVQRILPPPLDQEVELMLREMRVGSSVEQSLLSMSTRIKSVSLDAVLSGILIGRQVGGNLPEILETTASTLREMGRLEGVLRSKTAESKAQVYVLAIFPLVLGLGFNTIAPGYFTPMTSSGTGVVMLAAAVGFWIGSIVVARRILAVEL